MAETVNQGMNGGTNAGNQQDRTFTQAELNAIVADRLGREREKYAGFEDYKAKAEKFDAAEEAAKSELQKAQEEAARYKAQADALQKDLSTKAAREKVAQDTGVPVTLLTGGTEEECRAQADALLAWHGGQQRYPEVRDPGEPHKPSGAKTRDQFASWFNETLTK